jgi:hypothetical protein
MASGGRNFQLSDIPLLCVSVRAEYSIECRDSFPRVLTDLLACSLYLYLYLARSTTILSSSGFWRLHSGTFTYHELAGSRSSSLSQREVEDLEVTVLLSPQWENQRQETLL